MKENHSKKAVLGVAGLAFVFQIELASAVEFEAKNVALQALLGTKNVFKKTVDKTQVFYSKDPSGKPSKVAVLETGLYPPDCTHTWAIGLDPKSGAVTQIRVVEMKCQHAYPCKAASFLDQYKGKGPADMPKLKSQINTIAKATGTGDLTTAAVQRSVEAYQKIKSAL